MGLKWTWVPRYRVLVKHLLIRILGVVSWPGFFIINRGRAHGTRILRQLPDKNVLIVSNHQTYFADVAFMYHCITSSLAGFPDRPWIPGFLWKLKSNISFIAAEETIKSGWLPKLFRHGGAISVKRSWRSRGQPVQREVDPVEYREITNALANGWVITFPQGTTSPFAQGRKGTARLIMECQPMVIPVVIDGFRRAFDKKGLRFKKKSTILRLKMGLPLHFNDSDSAEYIMETVMRAIGQIEE